MASEGNAPRYSFDPLERRGLLLGLQAQQIAVALLGLTVAGTAAQALPSTVGPVVAAFTMLCAMAGTVWSKDSHPAPTWAAIVLRCSMSRLRGAVLSARPEAGICIRQGHVDAANGRRPRRDPFHEIAIVDLPADPGQPQMGAIVDRRAHRLSVILPVRNGSFVLLDPDEQARRLDLWRLTLNALGRAGTAVTRLQWIARTSPASKQPLLDGASAIAGTDEGLASPVQSYLELLGRPDLSGTSHDVWLILSVSALAGPVPVATRKAGEVVRRDARLLTGQLRSADLWSDGPMDRGSIARMFESAFALGPSAQSTGSAESWRPMAEEEHWAVYRAGASWHATYWIAEWPRIEVGPEFMSPLLLGGARRTVSVVMAPVPTVRAVREARSARTSDIAEEHLRAKAGFVPSARFDRVSEGAARREAELADGHVDYRFSGYVTVTASTRSELDNACAEAEQAALSAHLDIRRLYGRQREAFTWTLPIGRGLR